MTALIIIALFLYFIPYLIAAHRYHHQKVAIFMLNLFLGWTFLGWVIALIWSCTAVQKKQDDFDGGDIIITR
jgi:hypothetical protein